MQSEGDVLRPIFIDVAFACLFKRVVWQETRRELFHRAETVCEKRCRIVARERSGGIGSTSRLLRRGNAGAVTSRSPPCKQLPQRRQGHLHSRFPAQRFLLLAVFGRRR